MVGLLVAGVRLLAGLFLVVLFTTRVVAGSFEDGIGALDRADYNAAVKSFEKSVSEGNIEALYQLAVIHLDGPPSLRDRQRTVSLLTRAAAKNHADAQYILGVLHFEGIKGKGDPRAAAAWFEKAAIQGHPQAAYNLAVLLDEGNGVAKDSRRAVALYRQAANGGVLEAEHTLGSMLAFGRGARRDLVEGGMWLELALEGGDNHVREELDTLRRELTTAQTVEIKARVDDHRRRAAHHPN